MTYKLDAILERVTSPLILILPDGKELRFENGLSAVRESFDRRYVVSEICAADNTITVRLREQTGPLLAWAGKNAGTEAISFF